MGDATDAILADTANRVLTYGAGDKKDIKNEWWYRQKSRSSSLLIWINGMYFNFYAAYICFVWFFGGLLMWLVGTDEDFHGKYTDNSFLDALFMSAACVSQSGLATVNWSQQSTPVHV